MKFRSVLVVGSSALLSLAAILALVIPAITASENDEITQPIGLIESVDVDLVLIEAVVLDSKGRHVRGLTRDMFHVREGKVAVPIETFDEIDLGDDLETAPIPADQEQEPEVAVKEPLPPAAPAPELSESARHKQERRFIFLFDGYNNASPLQLSRARRAAKRFLKTEMTPEDLAAVYELSPFLASITSFTADRTDLEEGIDKVRYFPGESMGRQVVTNALYNGALGTRVDSRDRLLNAAEFGGTLMAQERSQFYRSMINLGEILEGISGRKIIIFMSGGFPIAASKGEMASGGFTLEFKQMIRQLQRAEATLFSFDIGEEKTGINIAMQKSYGATMDELGLGDGFLDTIGLGDWMGGETNAAYNQILAVVAHETGGSYMAGRNYERSFKSVGDYSRHFYLIGYRPLVRPGEDEEERTRKALTDRYRRISIKVDVEGTKVIARQGRIVSTAPAVARRPATAKPADGMVPTRPSIADTARAGHTLSCAPSSLSATGNERIVALPLALHGQVTPINVPGKGLMLDISTRITASSGEVDVASKDRTYRIQMQPEAREILRSGLRLTEAIKLPPGMFNVEVEMRLNGLGIDESWSGPVKVLPVEDGRFAVSDLSVVETSADLPLVADIFTSGILDGGEYGPPLNDPYMLVGGRRIPGVPRMEMDTSSPLLLFFRIFNAPSEPDDMKLRCEITPEDGGFAILPPLQRVYIAESEGINGLDVVVRIDLGAAEPGAYLLTLGVESGQARVTTEKGILIRRPEA